MKNRSFFGSLILLLTALIWGVAFVFQRSGMDSITPITFMAARSTLAIISIAVILLVQNGPKKAFDFDKKTIIGGIICGAVMVFASNAQQIGIVYTPAGKAGFITAMYILLVPLGNFLIFKKTPKASALVAVLLGALGLYLLCGVGRFEINVGDVWVFACAVGFTAHIIVIDRFAADTDPIKLSFIQFCFTALVSWILAFIFEEPSMAAIIEAKIPIAYCGFISAGVGFTLQIVGQKYTEPATASLMMSFESVFAALSGALLLNETMTAQELTGCGIMFFAILLVEIKEIIDSKRG